MTHRQIILFFILSWILATTGNSQNNVTDKNGLRQGFWKFTSLDTLVSYSQSENLSSVPPYTKSQLDTVTVIKSFIILEGFYQDGKKTGEWTSYYGPNYSYLDKKKSIFTFDNGIPTGKIQVFYENGTIKYEGIIKPNDTQVTVRSKGAPNSEFYSTSKIEIKKLISDWTNLDKEE